MTTYKEQQNNIFILNKNNTNNKKITNEEENIAAGGSARPVVERVVEPLAGLPSRRPVVLYCIIA